MKRFLSVLLIVCMLLSLCSCDLRSIFSKSKEKPLSEEDQIKQAALNLMRDMESKEDPTNLFSYFDGDYEISEFTKSKEGIKSMKRKDAITEIAAKAGKYYGIEAGGVLLYALHNNFSTEMYGCYQMQTDGSGKSTIFTSFGIDTSLFYGETVEEEPIELTADMLTVSEDKLTCIFSKEYMDALAMQTCEGLGYDQRETDCFMNAYEGSGVYSVAENKLTFELWVNNVPYAGTVKQILSYSVDEDQRVDVYSLIEYNDWQRADYDPTDKIEISCEDIIYQENSPVSGTIKVHTNTEANYVDRRYGKARFINATRTTNTSFVLDCSNGACPKASVQHEDVLAQEYQNQSWKNTNIMKMSLDLGKTSSQLSYQRSIDETILPAVKADKVVFGTPSSISPVPAKVTECILNYITNYL